MNAILQPPLPKNQQQAALWPTFHGSSRTLALSKLPDQGLKIIVVPNLQIAYQTQSELHFFSPECTVDVFPDWEVLPYDHFSPHEDIVSQRLALLHQLPQRQNGFLIISSSSLMHRLPPVNYIHNSTLQLSLHQTLNMNDFKHRLLQTGYQHVDQVLQHGEFAQRGSILDLFPMGSTEPYRIELFDDEIESLRTFDPDSQKTITKIQSIDILPGREFPLTADAITHFRQQWRHEFAGNPKTCPVYNSISEGRPIAGIEFYLSLFFKSTATFFDFIPSNSTLVLFEGIHASATQFQADFQHRFEQLRYDTSRPILSPDAIYLTADNVFHQFKSHSRIKLESTHTIDNRDDQSLPLPNVRITRSSSSPLAALQNFIHQSNTPILICAESPGRQEVLVDILSGLNVTIKTHQYWSDLSTPLPSLSLITAPLHEGFIIENYLAVITETELFGASIQQQRKNKTKQDPNAIIKNLIELQIGSPVVHIQHGVGRYQGLTTLTTGSMTAEYLTLHYANDDIMYVPVASLHLISRYTGGDSDHAPLHRLGSNQWQKAKDGAQKRIRDVAAELLDIYSQRANSQGHAFAVNKIEFNRFRQEFPFVETPDQTTAIDAVIHDMTQPTCMDRLICGDVGFGKTEVAMQAAFIAVNDHKQVAILTPTTLLAKQHYENFCDRFANWPIKIGVLSRLQSARQQQTTIEQCQQGQIDIIIGTHKLLQKQMQFKDLGLLVIDEEQRFGVRDKERIKALRANVDILTLTATPIPRTLNMALSNTRDLSIIATPPQRRLSIKTFVYPRGNSIIKEAIDREIMRGGQVYFLHNEVKSMEAQRIELQTLCPQIECRIAHGQMREKQLETVMSDFYHQKFQVLIASTIIESGIDIPTANTIIINRADKLGLAQLHQIRGRVGRSHHQAYAYLLTPTEGRVTKDAEKRLDAIQSLEDLGAGFLLATHDLEIRGAGELLGDEQSGQIHAIGFSMYMDLLEQAVQSLQAGNEPNFNLIQNQQAEVDLGVTALLPEEYISNVNIRLNLYKRLANCKQAADIENFQCEIIDRFGLLPEATQNLLISTAIRLQCEATGIKKCEIRPTAIKMTFNEDPKINPKQLIDMIQQEPSRYRLTSPNTLLVTTEIAHPKQQKSNFEKTIKRLETQ